jgi:formylglycine-generating enzyme required for sulfatase activity
MFKPLVSTLLLFLVIIAYGQVEEDNPPEGMVLIPGGTFMMGSDHGQAIAAPKHPVTLQGFYMDVREVTNKEYQEYCLATGYKHPEFWGLGLYKSGPDYPDHPVVGVSQFDATQYAEWAGKRLPTEAEWEYAARGGLEDISYPYGENEDHTRSRFNDPEAEKGPVKTGSYPPNGYGLFDMSGNAWEWVSDWFSESYYSESPEQNPAGTSMGTFRVFRGGGWHSGAGCTTVHRRNGLPPHWVDIAGGFRCVKELLKIADNQLDAFSVVRFEKISSLEQKLSGAGY